MMELVLNLEWTAFATVMCWLWLRHAPHKGPRRRVQLVGLALVLFTMFVVITMYDDMAMGQNPAEIRCFQREDDLSAHAPAPLHPVADLTPSFYAEPSLETSSFPVLDHLVTAPSKPSFTTAIQNRPPPAATSLQFC